MAEHRKRGIGGSDAAAAIGLNPYKSQLELWMEKTGRDKELPKPDPNDDSTPIFWGTVLEPIVAVQYAKKTGNKVRRINAVLQHPDPNLHWMMANLDREVMGNPEYRSWSARQRGSRCPTLEGGCSRIRAGPGVAPLAVTGKQARRCGRSDCRSAAGSIQDRARRSHEVARLIELERQFWHYVETDTPHQQMAPLSGPGPSLLIPR